jgi:hypothetical protein
MSKIRSHPIFGAFVGLLVLAYAGYSAYTGVLYGSKYVGVMVASDGAEFWTSIIATSAGGLYILFSAFFSKNDSLGEAEEAEEA